MDNVGKTTFCEKYIKEFPLTFRIKLPTPEIYSLIQHAPKEKWHDIFHNNIENISIGVDDILNHGTNVIADRYIYSHFVYETMTSKRKCTFKYAIKPDVIIYFYHMDPKSLPKNDFMEKEVDYELGQRLFMKSFSNLNVPIIVVKALQPDSVKIAIDKLEEIFGKRLYKA